MAENESRNERKKVEAKMRTKNKSGLSKVYYWVIGILFLILFLLVIYIFAQSGDKVDLGTEEDTSSIVQGNEAIDEEESSENKQEEPEKVKEDTEEDAEEESEETSDSEITINENAPLDTDHAVDYNNGSADRIAIKEKVMQATGLGNDLIENWVGNNGPGRVVADVYSPDKSEVYRVYLQYGDGEWHVTNYESLSSVP